MKKTKTKKIEKKIIKTKSEPVFVGGIRPLHDRIVIKEDDTSAEKQTASGIIIPVTVNEDKAGRRGTVIAVGPGRIEDGKTIKPSVSVGDAVIFQWGDKVRVDDKEYFIVRESEILAVVK